MLTLDAGAAWRGDGPVAQSFVALDLETTGPEAGVDAVIEVAAVRFVDGREADCFTTLIDPGQPVPLRVQQLTGIHPGMLRQKPDLAAVLPALAEFCGDLPLVAHNAAFDTAFLAAAGWQARGPVWCTLELGRVVLPLARNYRLSTLAAQIGAPLQTLHRAEDDARAAGRLCLALQEQIAAMHPRLLETLLRLAEPMGWPPAALLRAALARRSAGADEHWIAPVADLHATAAERRASDEPFDAAAILQLLEPGGAVAESFRRYEHRPEQAEMLRLVGAAVADGRHLLMEAGTGTGKSLAYLLPAVFWARARGEQVVVSTQTINLQEQLLSRDIPFLQQALDDPFRAALVKGRNNYICLRKWEEAAARNDFFFTAEERHVHMRIAAWLSATQSGDKQELGLSAAQEATWQDLQSESETCLGAYCKWYRRHCFAFRAKKAAREADVLVVNHSLLLTDLKSGGQVLPAHSLVVIDEAHHLEDAATQHLGVSVDAREVAAAMHALFRGWREGNLGLLPGLKRRLDAPEHAAAQGRIDELCSLVVATRAAADDLFRLLGGLGGRGREGEGDGSRLRLRPAVRQGPLWQAVDNARANAVGRLQALSDGLASVVRALTADEFLTAGDAVRADLEKYAAVCGTLAAGIDQVLLCDSPDTVTWLEAWGREERLRVSLKASPVDVGPVLRERLWQQRRSVILTSATLSVDGSFAHIQRRLGLADYAADRLVSASVASPFAYRKQALLLVPSDLPNPKQAGEGAFQAATVDFLQRFLVAAQGRTLVLFTSHRMLRQVYHELKDPLAAAGLVLLGQGLDGSRSRLVDEFRDSDRTVLMGSASFWEGVDIPGERLSSVVLVRLPFAPPGEPVTEARIEDLQRQGLNAFYHLAVPQAIIRFKQGFGRLVRTRTDRGVVVVLDNRISDAQVRYGRQFLRSLPPVRCLNLPQADLIKEAAAWLQEPALVD